MSAVGERVEALIQGETGDWLHFVHPSRIVEARQPVDVGAVISAVDGHARDRGGHAVGFVTYEAAAAFRLHVHPPVAGLPLAWFALFESGPSRFRHLSDWNSDSGDPRSDAGQRRIRSGYDLGRMRASVDRGTFERAFERIQRHIADGDTYQVNYTFRLDGRFSGSAGDLFVDLARSQMGRYSVFLRVGDLVICSASPELFFSRTGSRLTVRPMKGTAKRGRTLAEDHELRDRLLASPKERAENVMIVDMMRNDVGRVADVGTVEVPELLTVERYPTVWQMTSTVTGDTRASLAEIFAALHPSASVTGAPKVRTMEILSGLETGPRGIYTGAVGHVAPGGDARFNVAIRTAIVDQRKGSVSFGIGSGILWGSDPAAEYDECLLKAAVLGRAPPAFELLETLRWTPEEGFFLLDRHQRRLRDSAEYFGYRYDQGEVIRALSDAVAGKASALRVRLTLAAGGDLHVERAPLQPATAPARVGLAAEPIDPSEVFLYHKTTNRRMYDRAKRPGLDDVILWNGRGQVTEATIANLVVDLDGARVTPPVDCGLLAGTFRAELLERGEIREAVVEVNALRRAARLWLINSVQQWRPVKLVE